MAAHWNQDVNKGDYQEERVLWKMIERLLEQFKQVTTVSRHLKNLDVAGQHLWRQFASDSRADEWFLFRALGLRLKVVHVYHIDTDYRGSLSD